MINTNVNVTIDNETLVKLYILAFAILATSFIFYKLKK